MLYVDPSFSGNIATPEACVDKAATESFIALVNRHIQVGEAIFGSQPLELLSQAMSRGMARNSKPAGQRVYRNRQ